MDEKEFSVLIFYLVLVTQGIFFLDSYIGDDSSLKHWKLDSVIAYTVTFCEAFNENKLIIGAVMPERQFTCDDNGALQSVKHS